MHGNLRSRGCAKEVPPHDLASTTDLQVGSAKTWRTRVAHDDAYLDLGGLRRFILACGNSMLCPFQAQAEVQICSSLQCDNG